MPHTSADRDESILWTRRAMLQAAGLEALGLVFLGAGHARGQSGGATAAERAPLNRFPRMVQEYFVARVRAIEAAGIAEKEAISSRGEAEAFVRRVRGKIQQSFGPFPAKTPLNPRITGTVERDKYKIEKVIFESRPGFLVTANLYIPKGRAFPLPGVVGTCGHSSNGKAAEAYQSFAQGLARQGYVVLIFDPLGQGERLQYPDENLKSRVGVGTGEHIQAGNQQFLVGEFIGSWRAWDGIRALDYLLTRSEVDPSQVGVTGNSGGGTMTTWLCGVEQRWAMAAPSCFVTTFLHNLENELPADTEQCPPRALALGLNHEDFLAALAPKPVIILAKERDYFDVRGNEEAYGRLKRLYGQLGAADNIAHFAGPTYHGYTQENREAMYRWFNRVTRISEAQREPELVIESDETLYCTPRGQVADLESRSIPSLTRERSQALRAERGDVPTERLVSIVTELVKYPVDAPIPDYRILRPLRNRDYPKPHATNFVVETEPGIQAIVTRLDEDILYSRPPAGNNRAVLYVSHLSADAELRDEPLVRELLGAEPESTFYAVDVRGIGDSLPDTCGEKSFANRYGCDYFYAIHSIMLDDPYVLQKTRDLLGVIDWLASAGYSRIHLAARGLGTIPGTLAALLAEPVKRVTLKNALTSFSEVAESEIYTWPLSSLLPGVLHRFDLPDCYRALEAKELRQIDPWGAEAPLL